jgi:hypothetical protein
MRWASIELSLFDPLPSNGPVKAKRKEAQLVSLVSPSANATLYYYIQQEMIIQAELQEMK